MAGNMERENWGFTQISNEVLYDMNPVLSNPAFRIYCVLCRLCSNKKPAFPSYATLRAKCLIGSDATVRKALNELVNRGLLYIENRLKEGSRERTTNHYTIYNRPSPNAGYKRIVRSPAPPKDPVRGSTVGSTLPTVEVPSSPVRGSTVGSTLPTAEVPSIPVKSIAQGELGSTLSEEPTFYSECRTVLHSVKNRSTVSVEKEYIIKNKEVNEGGGEAPQRVGSASPKNQTHPPTKNMSGEHLKKEHGEFGKALLTSAEYVKLVGRYGSVTAHDYVSRLDAHIASTGRKYADHYATIIKWVEEDKREIKEKKPSRFANFDQRVNDYAALERMEREKLMKSLPADGEGDKA